MKKVVGIALVGALVGCHSRLDIEREPVDTGSFGNTVITLVCKRIAYLEDLADGTGVVDVRGDTYRDVCRLGLAPPATAPDPLKALQAKRTTLVDAIDATFPEAFLPTLQGFLTSNDFLRLYDDRTAIEAVDSLIEMLRFFAADEALAPALERLEHRLGYAPMDASLGAVRAFVNYPDLHEFLGTVVREITPGGRARAEWDSLVAAVAVTLRNAAEADDADSPERTGALALSLLLDERALLGTSRTIPLVRRDHRGLARVRLVDGHVAAPFVDLDDDGLADVDELGRFVDEQGAPLAAPTPFSLPAGEEPAPWLYRDGHGRALMDDDGDTLYEYVDLDATVFAALARDGVQLFDPQKGTALDALRGASALMGPRELSTREYESGESLTYRGYDPDRAPLLDMAHAYLQVLRDPNIFDVLALARVLLTERQAEAARLAEAVIDAARTGERHPGAALVPGSPLFDDLVPVLRDILATPGLAEDLFGALERTEVADLGQRFADYMKYTDQFTIHPETQALVGSFGTEVDRAAEDSNWNRSLMQRLLHLIADSNRAVMCNKQDAVVRVLGVGVNSYDECQLVRVDNMAVFYVQSMAYARDGNGNFICDDGTASNCNRWRTKARFDFNWGWIGPFITDNTIESMIGIEGFRTHPTPHALNRVMFLDPPTDALADVMDPARCRDGDQYKTAHGGTLPVWETDGFYEQIRPIVQVFADHDAEQLFVDLLSVLHQHWPSRASIQHQHLDPGGHGYAWASNLQSYEPAMVEVLERGLLLEALVHGAPALNATTVNGKTLPRILTDAGRYLLTPQPGLENRQGETTSATADGRPVEVLSPWQLLADAYERKQERMDAAVTEGEAWQRSMRNLVDVLARGDAVPGEGWRFRNPRFAGVMVALVDFLEARLLAHDLAGDRDLWLKDDLIGRLEGILSGPVFAGAADFVLSLQASPEARAQIEALAAYLVDEVTYNEAFLVSLIALADLLQLAQNDRDILPVAHVLGEALRPEHGWLEAQLTFARAAREADREQALVAMLRHLHAEYRPGHTALGGLLDGVAEVLRARPYEDLGERYTAADYRALFSGVADFLDEEKRGLRRFIRIIETRHR